MTTRAVEMHRNRGDRLFHFAPLHPMDLILSLGAGLSCVLSFELVNLAKSNRWGPEYEPEQSDITDRPKGRKQRSRYMDLNDLFDRDQRHSKQGHRNHNNNHGLDGGRHREYDDHPGNGGHSEESDRWLSHRDRQYSQKDQELFDLSHFLQRLLENKKLLILAGVVLLAVIALVVIFALPLLGQALDYVDKSGLKGIVDRLLQGTGGAK